MNYVLTFAKRNALAALLIMGAAAVLGFILFRGGGEPQAEFIIVERKNIIQEVSVTGKTKAAKETKLAFEITGRVAEVYADVGNKVAAGQILVQLDARELASQTLEAQAAADFRKAELEELLRGTRPEEITVQETKVKNAEAALAEAEKNLRDKVRDAFTKSDDAIRNKTDQFFSNPTGSNPAVTFAIGNPQLKNSIELGRTAAETTLLGWKSSLAALDGATDPKPHASEAGKNLETIKQFLEKVSLALSVLSPTTTLTQTTIDGWRSDASTARTNVNTAIANLSSAEEKLQTKEADLAVAENELALKIAGTTPEELAAKRAQLAEAEAKLNTARIKESKTIIYSPLKGIVTRQDAKKGEIAAANTALITVVSDTLELEANIPEVDIAKIKLGDKARVTLDAYGEDVVFEAQISSVDPAETVIEGVATYKTALQFAERDERVKPGLTANIDVLTAARENVLSVPIRALITKNGQRVVRVLNDDGTTKETEVATGLRGSYGDVEIISGLKEGARVITAQ